MSILRVRPGDCVWSLAVENGFDVDTVWNEPDNRELKSRRDDPNVLQPDDVVRIPEKRARQEHGGTERRHRFRRKGVPGRLRIVLLDHERQPLRGASYDLWIDGTVHYRGWADDDGLVDVAIPPGARKGELFVDGEEDRHEYELLLGHLDPLDEVSGVQGRLANLGFDPGPIDGIHGPLTSEALERFQRVEGLERTGQLDASTRARLSELAEE
jgi:N-acetylmuramoyl-L-alanine amidase